MEKTGITIVELPEFEVFSKQNLSIEECEALFEHIARHPEDGVLVSGTGGLRKLRWARKGEGKSGGYRIIYYYYNENVPVFLITGFAKKDMENITKAMKNQYKNLMPKLIAAYKNKGDR